MLLCMNTDESSISIINRNHGQVTGERTGALPIKLITSISWVKFILIGVIITIIGVLIFLYTVKKQVTVVEVTGKSDQFQLFQIN